MSRFIYAFLIAFFYVSPSEAQTQSNLGIILSVSGRTVIANFENTLVSIGDEIMIIKRLPIIDPITGKVRGERKVDIAMGIVDDFGLGKTSIRITQYFIEEGITTDELVMLTGKEKKIIRPTGPNFGEIQEISDDTIVTSLSASDEISEGDIFLIQRTEPVYDPETQEIVGANQVNVGRLAVDSVSDMGSVTKILEKKDNIQITDTVVKESDWLKHLATLRADSSRVDRLEEDVVKLRGQLERLKASVDSLGFAHAAHKNEFDMLKSDIERVLSSLVKGDIIGTTIRLRNDEPLKIDPSGDLFTSYRRALNLCLDNKLEEAIQAFNAVLAAYPDSPLNENCRYWIAQSYFAMKAYTQALEGFSAVIRDTRFTHKDDDSSIMLGITYLRMERTEEARQAFERFTADYPDSEYQTKVRYWIGRL